MEIQNLNILIEEASVKRLNFITSNDLPLDLFLTNSIIMPVPLAF